MSSQLTIDPPTPLFVLPYLLNSSTDRIRSGRAFSIRQSRRNICPEIPFAIDGQSLSVYNISTGNLVFAFPVPPRTRFICDPTTVSIRHKGRHAPVTYSYATCRDGGNGSSVHIKCFRFDHSKAIRSNEEAIKITECTIDTEISGVISLNPLPQSDADWIAHEVLVCFESGDLACYGPDLLEQHWKSNVFSILPSLGKPSDTILEHVTVNPYFPQQRHAWLRRAAGEKFPTNVTSENSEPFHLLGLITRCAADGVSNGNVQRQVHLLAIKNGAKSTAASQLNTQHLCSFRIPEITSDLLKSVSYVIDLKAGLLHQSISDRIMSLEFGHLALLIKSDFHSPFANSSNPLTLFGTHVMIIDPENCAIYDTRHGSVQASTRITREPNESGKKRKRDHAGMIERHMVLVDYFERSMIAIALADSQVLAVRIRLATDTPLKRRKASLLSSSLGRGSKPKQPTNLEISDFMLSLKDVLHQDDAPRLETAFQEGLSSAQSAEQREQMVLYTMSQLFKGAVGFASRTTDSASVAFPTFTPSLFEWLVRRNLVNEAKVNQSLRLFVDPSSAVTTNDLIDYIVTMDPSFEVFTKFIANAVPVALSPLLRSIVVILRSFNSLANDADTQNADRIQSTNEALVRAEQAAVQDLSTAVSLLTENLSISRGYALKICINQLAVSYNPKEITRAMRAEMTNSDLALLIELLRTEISGAGWGSHCLDVYPAQPDAVESQNEALAAICRLLDCSLDALGAGGWLGALQTSNPTMLSSLKEVENSEDLITSLRLETSTALETVQESTFLQGFLRDFFRFDRAFQESVAQAESRGDWAKYPKLSELFTTKNPSLPVGLGTIKLIEPTRIAAGGEIQRRTKRDIGQKLSKTVEKYTFERIVV